MTKDYSTMPRRICAFGDGAVPKPLSKADSMYGYEWLFRQKKHMSMSGIMSPNIGRYIKECRCLLRYMAATNWLFGYRKIDKLLIMFDGRYMACLLQSACSCAL